MANEKTEKQAQEVREPAKDEPNTADGRVKAYCTVCAGPMPPCKKNNCVNTA